MRLGVVVSVCAAIFLARPALSMEVKVPSGPYPSVFLTPDEAAAVRSRATEHEWAKAVRDGVLKNAAGLVDAELDIPREGGQWSHWYTCKKDGGGLNAKSPTEHVCRVCGEVYSGWPYDQVYVNRRHGYWLSGIETLGVAYLLDPKPAYAERAREILLTYASFYETLERHDRHGKDKRPGGRLYAQTLDEAVILCRICLGYDLVHGAPCFTAEDHKAVEDHFLRPMVANIRTNESGISNWQSWHNAGVGCAGFLLRDAELVGRAVNDPKNGFLMQMRKSVLDSGMWYEGAPSYHWYALSAHVYLMEAAARSGMDLYGLPIVKRLFEGPVDQLYPDGTFPAIQDSNRSSIAGARQFYDVAYRRYGDEAFLGFVGTRNSIWALLWGADTVPEASGMPLALATSNSESQGLAVLRDRDNKTALFFDYGKKYGGHIHPAKLGMTLFAHGDERVVDPGRLPYGNPIHGQWYRQTIAHNTVVVNRKSQENAPAKLVAFRDNGNFVAVRAKCERAYPGVVLERTVLLHGNVVIDVFDVTSEDEATFDLPLHLRAELVGLPHGTPVEVPADTPGYMHLKDYVQLTDGLNEFVADCGQGQRIHVTMLDESDVFSAKGFGASPQELVPIVIRRKQGKEHRFITVFQILEDGVSAMPVMSSAEGEVTVETGREDVRRVRLSVTGQGTDVSEHE